MFTHRIDTWTFCFKSLSLSLSLSVSLSVSLSIHPTTAPQTTHRKPRHCTHQQSHTHLPNPTPHWRTPATQQRSLRSRRQLFFVSIARRLMLPHLAVPDPSGIATACPNESATGLTCAKPVDAHQHHCYGCRCGEASTAGMPQWPDALPTSSKRATAPRFTLSKPFPPER